MTEPRKVVIFTSEFPPGPGGIGNHAWNLASWLWRKGVSVEVIAPTRQAFSAEEPVFDAKQPFPIRRYVKGKKNVSGYFALLYLIACVLQSMHRGDIFLLSGMKPLILGGVFARLWGRKIVFGVVAHGLDINPAHPMLKRLVHWALMQFRFVIPVSRFTASRLPQLNSATVMVVNNGVNVLEYLDGMTKPETCSSRTLKGKPALITVGTLSFRKGQINVVRALPAIRQHFPEVHYHMVGLPHEADKILEEAERLGVKSFITIHGAVDEDRKKALLRDADIFVMLSNHSPDGDFEGFGIAILEANLLGVPAIGSADSGISDAIAHGESGLLVDPLDSEMVARAVCEIMKNRSSYARRAQAHAMKFDWDIVVKKYIDVFNEVLCADLQG